MRKYYLFSFLIIISMILSSCAKVTPEIIKETVEVKVETTKIVESTKLVEATKLVEQTKIVEQQVVITATPEPTQPPPELYHESPMLAEKVKAGELPPVTERLPGNPMVVAPLVEQGTFGGDLRFGFVGSSPAWGGVLYLAGWEHLVFWKPDFSAYEPNILESYEVSPDAKEFTFHLRKGMKWSDGEPYTADDIIFFLDDVLGNTDLFPAGRGADWLPAEYAADFKDEKIDDYTVKLTFPKPYGTFMFQLATWGGRQFAQYPKHYLQQFHKKYNPDVDKLVAEDGVVADWIGLFFKKGPDTWGDPQRFFDNVDLPSLGPWIVKQPLGTGTTIILERNPYYWKVDPAGNQLPYIDRIVGTSFQDDSSRIFAMLNGDLDYIQAPSEPNREIFYNAVSEGKPIVIKNPVAEGGNNNSIQFNLTTKDPIKNEVFNNKDFRIGMSYAINRQEMIEVLFNGQGKPAQVAPLESSPLYNEQLANQYIEYDVAKANEYLDKVLPNKDGEGFRLDKNGKRFQPIFTVVSDFSYGLQYPQTAEMLKGYWAAVGIDVVMDVVTDQVNSNERRATNDVEIFLYHGSEGGAGLVALVDPRFYVPGEFWGEYGMAWWLYRANAEDVNGQKMPEYAQQVRDMYVSAIQQPTIDGQVAIMKLVMQRAADIFWIIGISRPGPGYAPVNTTLHNIPDTWIGGWTQGNEKLNRPEQWWLTK